jgi:hypothetical protein
MPREIARLQSRAYPNLTVLQQIRQLVVKTGEREYPQQIVNLENP